MSGANTTYMILCTALVCLMTPGLAFFYGGLTRKKNVLILMMRSFIAMGIVTLIWIFGGFSLAFGPDIGGIIGNPMTYFALHNVGVDPNPIYGGTIPFLLFFAFQLMFCVITVPLMTGAFTERMTMKSYIIFLIAWTILVYLPVCHWVWGGGFLQKMHFVDFSGGAVIHTTAGFSALVCVLLLGKREWKVTKENGQASNLMAAAIGTGLLWFGWFGFNAGSSLAANRLAAIAFSNTFISLATAMIVWLLLVRLQGHKTTFVDVLTGSVAGLATITPASGYIEPIRAVIVGLVAGVVCTLAVSLRKKKGWDDALDVWGVHGVGGLTGTILIGLLATKAVNGVQAGFHTFMVQTLGVVGIALYAMAWTWIILKIMLKTMTVKPTVEEQVTGLDQELLGEVAYHE